MELIELIVAMVCAFPGIKERKRYSAGPCQELTTMDFHSDDPFLAPKQRCRQLGEKRRSIILMRRDFFAFQHRAESILLGTQCSYARERKQRWSAPQTSKLVNPR